MAAYTKGHLYYYRCRPRSYIYACENRRSHRAEDLEYQATRLFEQIASTETLLALYDQAVQKQEKKTDARGVLERRGALSERLSELETERRGYLRQNARGLISDAELAQMIAEVDEQRRAVTAELAAVQERARAAQRLREARKELVAETSRYSPVHADWQEDPDAIMPGEVLTHATHPEDIRRTYRRYGARFHVDAQGILTLKLRLGLDGEAEQGFHFGHSSG